MHGLTCIFNYFQQSHFPHADSNIPCSFSVHRLEPKVCPKEDQVLQTSLVCPAVIAIVQAEVVDALHAEKGAKKGVSGGYNAWWKARWSPTQDNCMTRCITISVLAVGVHAVM